MNRQSNKITALYCRMAHYQGDMDALTARNQMERLAAYVAETGLQNPEFFCDWGFSGTTAERPEYQRMLREVEARNVSDLVVMNMSRLCRGLAAWYELWNTVLPRAGVTLHILQEGAVFTPRDAGAEAEQRNELLALFQEKWQKGRRK